MLLMISVLDRLRAEGQVSDFSRDETPHGRRRRRSKTPADGSPAFRLRARPSRRILPVAHRELRVGGLTGSEVPDIHQLGNPDVSGQDLIAIHIYAPPLGVLKTYKLGSSTIDLYTPADPDI